MLMPSNPPPSVQLPPEHWRNAERVREKNDEFLKNLGRAERANWPSFLLKALSDPFDYALRLKSGEMIYFNEASYVNDEWVELRHPSDLHDTGKWNPPCPRGKEVRVSEIVWIADAPFDS